ncbi:hypothetical protein IU470_07610 [Nocardia abscessus]|uniref:Lipoprotein n=1 Tax=Nocardia abscessus TaxID=120957 RepID=A0ABS0C5D7_9NOCA|nr:hypothetical protein [Nocardia abscessus]MBF6224975.1 hypothetical protein [Nocardia abscessus]
MTLVTTEDGTRCAASASCYFENLDRTDATGPEKYTGTGKTKDAAEKDAWNKAQAAAPKGRKVKHCRVESSSKK